MSDQAPQTITAGARVGALVGCTAWAVALGLVVAAAGEPLLGLELGALGVAAGYGLGQLTLLAVARAEPARRVPVLWGGLLVTIGVLLLVWGIGMVPLLEGYPDVYEALGRVGGTAVIPLWVCTVLIATGSVLLTVAARDA